MFERFTSEARMVVVAAQHEARDLQHAYIGTEHLLLSLLEDQTGPIVAALRDRGVDRVYVRDEIIKHVGTPPAASTDPLPDADAEDTAALKAIGIDLDAVRRAIEDNFGPGALRMTPAAEPKRRWLRGRVSVGRHIPFTTRAKKVLELSLREALRLKNNFIAPEHILLGILREGQGLAARILADAGTDVGQLRADLARSLKDRAA